MPNKEQINIVLVDDHAILREGIASLLNNEEYITVVGQAAEGSRCLQLVDEHRPDIVIMDIRMPGLSGIEACSYIKKYHPETKVIILSMYEEEEYVRKALTAGADGYLLKEIVSSELIAAVYKVSRGESVLSEPVLKKVLDDYGHIPSETEEDRSVRSLSYRQMEILNLIGAGKRNREIAEALNFSEKTVEKEISTIYRKLGVSSRSEAIAQFHRLSNSV